jgi:hypothetical protein
MPLTTYTAGQVLTAASLNSNFNAAGGLQFVKAQTIGSAVSSVTVTGAFSADFDNYYITIVGGTASANPCVLQFTLGSTTANYYYANSTLTYAGVAGTAVGNNVGFFYCGEGGTATLMANFGVQGPFLTKTTSFTQVLGAPRTTAYSFFGNGFLNDTTSYTAFTITPSSGTLTGGSIRVYGYQNS